MGRRISDMRLTATGAPILAGKDYIVSGWGSVNETVEGPPVWDVVAAYLKDRPPGCHAQPASRQRHPCLALTARTSCWS